METLHARWLELNHSNWSPADLDIFAQEPLLELCDDASADMHARASHLRRLHSTHVPASTPDIIKTLVDTIVDVMNDVTELKAELVQIYYASVQTGTIADGLDLDVDELDTMQARAGFVHA